MFQLNDIELAGLSAKLIASLVLPELLEEEDSEMMLVFAKTFLTVQTNSEIYGFSTILYDLSSNVQVSRAEQQLIIEGIHFHLISNGNEIATFNKITMLKILEKQIDSSIENPALQAILQMLVQLLPDSELHNEIFSCFSAIIESFPNFTSSIFENVAPIAIQSLHTQNVNSQQSIIYFFDTLISEDTIQYYQNVIPIILPLLLSILQSEVDTFKSDVSIFFEHILQIYNGDVIQLIESQQNKSNLAFLLAFCVIAKNKKGDVNFPFIFAMISSPNDRERCMAVRCVKKLVKSGIFNEQIITESIKHLNGDIAEVCYEVIGLLGELASNQNFAIETFFENLMNFYVCDDPLLNAISYQALKKIIKMSSSEKVIFLVPLVLTLFEECLKNPQLHENLISLSTLMQSISFELGEKYSPFAEHSLNLLQKMSNIDFDFMIHTFTPIAFIASKTHFLPFLERYCNSMLTTIQTLCVDYEEKTSEENLDENYFEMVETTIDSVINSVFFIMEAFDIKAVLPQFLTSYFILFHMTFYNKIISGFNDILIKYPEFVLDIGERLSQLLVASSDEFIRYVDDDEDEANDELAFLADLLNLIKVIVVDFDADQSFYAFVFDMLELCQKFVSDVNELKYVSLNLINEMVKRLPDETFAFIQSHDIIKGVILFGLNEVDYHSLSQSIVDAYGTDSF